MTRMILFSLTLLVILPLGSLLNLLLAANTTLEWIVIALQTTTLFALNRIVGRWYWFNYNIRQFSLVILTGTLVVLFVQGRQKRHSACGAVSPGFSP